jgi:hypothetical protein
MNISEKLAQMGRTQLVKDVELLQRLLFHARRLAGIREKRERIRIEAATTAIELQLDDAAAALGLPPDDPRVIASVIFHGMRNAERRAEAEEDESYPSFLGGGDW